MSKLEVLKGAMELTIMRPKNKRVPRKPSCKASPLQKNFDKWSDKPRKLYVRDLKQFPELKFSHSLEGNVFGQLLASPMRLDKLTRVRAPKELLKQAKLRTIDCHNSVADGKKFELVPAIGTVSGLPTSYLSNSQTLIQRHAANMTKVLPTSSTNSNIRYIDRSEILIQPELFLKNQRSVVLETVLKALTDLSKAQSFPLQPRDGDMVVTYDSGVLHPIGLRKLPQGTAIVLNLFPTQDCNMKSLLETRDVVIQMHSHKELCFTLYRLIAEYF